MRELVDGSTAISRGAVAAGCSFFAGYPITPASPILMQMMRELPKVGGVAIQAEDEIASIGMCIGATLAGARAMTVTSGPGMSLYSENLGLAIMGEVPLVVVDVQRLGPATGGATTSAQGDVQLVRWGTAGGYPIIALAPSSVPECFRLTIQAFDLAERFRCPVFVLTDKELNLTLSTVESAAWEQDIEVRERRPQPLEAAQGVQEALAAGPVQAYRYQPADDVAPLRHYGERDIVRFTGSTHDERAFITKHPPTVEALNRHLAAKIKAHRSEIELVKADTQPEAEALVVSYGTTARAVREAVQVARHRGTRVSSLILQSLWPVPEGAIRAALGGICRVVVAELNHGLYRREIERLASPEHEIVGLHRLDGELIAPEEVLEALT